MPLLSVTQFRSTSAVVLRTLFSTWIRLTPKCSKFCGSISFCRCWTDVDSHWVNCSRVLFGVLFFKHPFSLWASGLCYQNSGHSFLILRNETMAQVGLPDISRLPLCLTHFVVFARDNRKKMLPVGSNLTAHSTGNVQRELALRSVSICGRSPPASQTYNKGGCAHVKRCLGALTKRVVCGCVWHFAGPTVAGVGVRDSRKKRGKHLCVIAFGKLKTFNLFYLYLTCHQQTEGFPL